MLKEGAIYLEGDQVGRIAEQEAGGMGLYEAQIAKRPDGDRGVRYQPDGGDQYALMGEAGFGECEVRYEQYDETGRGTRRSSRNGANSWVLAEGDQAVGVIGQNAVDTAIDQPPHFRFVVGVKGMYDEPQAMRFVA